MIPGRGEEGVGIRFLIMLFTSTITEVLPNTRMLSLCLCPMPTLSGLIGKMLGIVRGKVNVLTSSYYLVLFYSQLLCCLKLLWCEGARFWLIGKHLRFG